MIVLGVISLLVSIAALVVAIRNKGKEVVVETRIERAPVEHPFTYDEEKKAYYLDGELYAKNVSCLKGKGVEYGTHK